MSKGAATAATTYISRDEIYKMACDTIPVIERDTGKPLDKRHRAVITHWMIRNMMEVRHESLTRFATAMQTDISALKAVAEEHAFDQHNHTTPTRNKPNDK